MLVTTAVSLKHLPLPASLWRFNSNIFLVLNICLSQWEQDVLSGTACHSSAYDGSLAFSVHLWAASCGSE